MAIHIPEEVYRQIGLSEQDIKKELAAWLYEKTVLTLAQAASFSGISRLEMQAVLANHKIDLHITPEDVKSDVEALKKLNLL